MGKLIIDDNTVYEIDEECIKNQKIPEKCDIKKWFSGRTEEKRKENE